MPIVWMELLCGALLLHDIMHSGPSMATQISMHSVGIGFDTVNPTPSLLQNTSNDRMVLAANERLFAVNYLSGVVY